MRIIGGTARGAALFAPKGLDTRPTRDQVKESLFNILQGCVPEATVLDLFAGSGALGLESVSRGAARAGLVDRDREAGQCIRRNIEKLRFQDRVALLQCDWTQAVQRLRAEGPRFDLVFLDPPYRMEALQALCDTLAAEGLLAPEAVVVWEHRADVAPRLSAAFVPVKERSFGDTAFHLYRWTGEA